MELILKEDVTKLGLEDDIVTVKNGFGRNYLIPRGYAILATVTAKKIHAENQRQRAHKLEKIKNEALEIAKKMEGLSITIGAKASTSGKIFGSVNTIQIAESLNKEGFKIERKNVTIKEDQVKEIGKYTATVKLHREVKVNIEFVVVAE